MYHQRNGVLINNLLCASQAQVVHVCSSCKSTKCYVSICVASLYGRFMNEKFIFCEPQLLDNEQFSEEKTNES